MFCGNCGKENPDNSSYCNGCGSPLTSAARNAARPGQGGWQQFPGGMQQYPQQGIWPMQANMPMENRQLNRRTTGMLPPGMSKSKFAWNSGNTGTMVVLLLVAVVAYMANIFLLYRRFMNYRIISSMAQSFPWNWIMIAALEAIIFLVVLLAHISLNAPLAWIGAGLTTTYVVYNIYTFISSTRGLKGISSGIIRVLFLSYGPALVWMAATIIVAALITSISRKYSLYRKNSQFF
ncbi:MAG: zinc ribbon domain-containing protein [Lachnospiraceae bacterium]|nr:zinc ribbon domain-containing protein [Lachnospiraceae bacterium]